MKVLLVVFLAVCAYGRAASIEPRISKNGTEIIYTTADQVVHGLTIINFQAEGLGLVSWFDAQKECVWRGYKGLVSIKSQEDQTAVEYALINFNVPWPMGTWIGLHRLSSAEKYKWSDGTALGTFTKWEAGQPGTSAVGGVIVQALSSSTVGKWRTVSGGLTTGFYYAICEF